MARFATWHFWKVPGALHIKVKTFQRHAFLASWYSYLLLSCHKAMTSRKQSFVCLNSYVRLSENTNQNDSRIGACHGSPIDILQFCRLILKIDYCLTIFISLKPVYTHNVLSVKKNNAASCKEIKKKPCTGRKNCRN